MRFACLGSGSKGNAWLVESGKTRVMLDCGFGLSDTARRLARLGLVPEDVSALVLTHEHSDHVRGALPFSRRHGCPVWMSHGTRAVLAAQGDLPADACRVINGHDAFAVGDLSLQAFPVPHDAREPVQYVVTDGAVRWGLLTDLGHVTAHVQASLAGCHALALECNHDTAMLQAGRYPPALKKRILGNYGHLDNSAAATLLGTLVQAEGTPKWTHIVAAHLSEENNSPDLARQALAAAMGCEERWIGVADQETGLDWRAI